MFMKLHEIIGMVNFKPNQNHSFKMRNSFNYCGACEIFQYRSNQINEGGNKHQNFVGEEVVRQGARPTLESWCEQQQLLEN